MEFVGYGLRNIMLIIVLLTLLLGPLIFTASISVNGSDNDLDNNSSNDLDNPIYDLIFQDSYLLH